MRKTNGEHNNGKRHCGLRMRREEFDDP